MSNDLIKYNIKETAENNYLNNNNNNNNNINNNSQENKEEKEKKPEEKLNLIQLENEKIDGDADKFKEEKEESTSKNSDKVNKKIKKGVTNKKNDNNKKTPKTPEADKNQEEENKEENDSKKANKNVNMDTSTYNKLKSHVIKGEEVLWMSIMKYVGYSFVLLSLLFSYLFYISQINELEELNEYCHENLIFNHSKIDFGCLFIASKNIYYTKFNISKDDSCYGHESCKQFYLEMLSTCLTDLEKSTQNTSYFDQDFVKILQKSIQVNLSMYLTSEKEQFIITKKNLFILILSMAFDYSSNIKNYFENYRSIYDIMNINVCTNSLYLFNDKTLVGFNEDEKRKHLDNPIKDLSNYSFIIELCILIIFSAIFSVLIFQVNNIELDYIRVLIRFNSKPFEDYLTSLFELKKSLTESNSEDLKKKKNDNNEDINDAYSSDLTGGKVSEKNKLKKENEPKDDDDELVIQVDSNNKNISQDRKTKESDMNSKKREERKSRKKKDNKKGRGIGIKQLKIQAMSKYFKQMNIFFIVKIIITFLFSFSFFIVLIIMEKNYKKILLDLDEVINDIGSVYKDGFYNLLLLKNITQAHIEYQIEKMKAKYYFEQGDDTYMINDIAYDRTNITLYKVISESPSNLKLVDLKLGNALMIILNDDSIDLHLREKLNELYNGNSCKVLFNDTEQTEQSPINYGNCILFWSAILQKGMEQSITQMIIEKNSVEDELSALSRGDKNITDIMQMDSAYRRFEFFVIYYFLKSFWETSKIFEQIKELKIDNIRNIYLIITIVYMVITFFLIIVVKYVIRNSKKIFNSFLNFIVILPAKYLRYDSYFLEEVLKLEDKLY